MSDEREKRCGTCRWWGEPHELRSGQTFRRAWCLFPLPTWLIAHYTNTFVENSALTPDRRGDNCPTWAAKDDATEDKR